MHTASHFRARRSVRPHRAGLVRTTAELYFAHLGAHFGPVVLLFLAPALVRAVWTVALLEVQHIRHPDWPLHGILINPGGGFSIFWSTLFLHSAGWVLFAWLAGPALARTVERVAHTRPGLPHRKKLKGLLGELSLQGRCIFRAWGPLLVGLVVTMVYADAFLRTAAPSMIVTFIWYALAVATLVLGFPFGLWLQIRYAFALPLAVAEGEPAWAGIGRSKGLAWQVKARAFTVLLAALAARAGLWAALIVPLNRYLHPAHVLSWSSQIVLFAGTGLFLDALSAPVYGIGIARLTHENCSYLPGAAEAETDH